MPRLMALPGSRLRLVAVAASPAAALPAPMSAEELVAVSDVVARVRVVAVTCVAVSTSERTGEKLPSYKAELEILRDQQRQVRAGRYDRGPLLRDRERDPRPVDGLLLSRRGSLDASAARRRRRPPTRRRGGTPAGRRCARPTRPSFPRKSAQPCGRDERRNLDRRATCMARRKFVPTNPSDFRVSVTASAGEQDHMDPRRSFQGLILELQRYWADYGCVILQPYDMEVGAGTFHPATTLRSLGPRPWNAAYVQPSRRPKDGRYGENPNRLQHYYQYQVILKPSPPDLQDLYLGSLTCDRHRPRPARHPLRRGRLGEPHARRLGARLGVLVRRHGGVAVHLFPAGGGLRMRAGVR